MLRRICLSIVVLCGLSIAAWASPDRGEISGTVNDPQGAVVPGADVRILNVDTGIEIRLTTNSVGFFLATELVPGNYTVRIKAAGFNTTEITAVVVGAGRATAANVTLKVGDSSQKVEVTAEVPLIESSSSNFTTAVDSHYIADLPLQGRDIQTLVQLLPGVIQSSGPSGASFGFNSQFGGFPDPLHLVGSGISVNGSQAGANGWYLEGTLNATVGAEAAVVNPAPDAVSEFNLVSNGLAAEYGRTSGGVVNIALKSGSNTFHGSAYGYNRNSFFSATNPFARRDSSGTPLLQPRVNWNDGGVTFGGPVIIPHIYNGKNRTFFFVSEDYSILHENVNRILTVPLAAERNGNFTGDPRYAAQCDPAAGITNCIYDPFTTTGPDANGLLHRQPFVSPIIPGDRINPIAKYYLNTIPNPNYLDPLQQGPDGCGFTCNNYIGAVGSGMTTHNFSIKIDHHINDKHNLFFDFLYNPSHYENFRYPWNGPTAQTGTGVMGAQPYNTRNMLAIIGLNSSITPTLVNELRISYARQALTSLPNPESVTNTADVKKIWAGMNLPLSDPYQSVPNISFDGFSFGPIQYQNGSQGQQAYSFSDNVTKVSGKHTLKAGASFQRNNLWNATAYGVNMNFDSSPTNDPVTQMGGSGLATFLLGWAAQGSPGSGVQYAPWQTNDNYGFFAQDDFRVRNNLTLSIGLRWDIFGWIRERHDALANIDFNMANPQIPAYQGAMVYVNSKQHPDRNLFPADKGSFAPRFGFSWSPAPKTVVRGAFGILYSNSMSSLFGQGNGAMSTPGFSVPISATITDQYGLTPSFILGQPAPTLPFPDLSQSRKNNLQNLGQWTPAFFQGSKDPYVETWSFFIQRELPSNIVISAGYVGSHGLHLMSDEIRNVNTVPVSTQLKLRDKINLEYPVDPALGPLYGCDSDPATGKALCSGWYAFLPHPQYPVIAALMAPDGINKYNAAQLRVEKRYSHGLNVVASYTFSKNMVSEGVGAMVANTPAPTTISNKGVGRIAWVPGAAGGGVADGSTHTNAENTDARRLYDALAPDDTPHVFNVAATYDLPFGKGKSLLNQGGAVNAIFGGWKLTQNWNFQSGVPMFFDWWQNYDGIYSSRPNLVGNPSAGRGSMNKQQRENQWYNPNAFTAPFGSDPALLKALSTGVNPDGSAVDYNAVDAWWNFGNVGLRPPGGRTPAFWNVDASLSKEWRFTEARILTFRYDLFNALNHQNLGVPDNHWCLPPNADGSTDLVHQFGCQFGKITNVQTDPRAMQFGLKFRW